ncbi:MAG TPA: hypothetical protein PLM96_04410 [Methanoregulaceae archaeon]|nr:hypothetical protein [Methanoregulaceae archaeon]MDD5049011.1 hypothetical protein [Methanoregulaceae archaeon]MDD5685269.1 hypothetical protein [Methanoregulaceae archaeon]HOP67892.1 hypothetical protein [Methanoregulaceae archaeon]HPJ74391.1 hypothetical protein [Methanoregulaceae archaeon]
MSKNNMSEGAPVHSKPVHTSKVAAVLIILCFLGIMPILVWTTLPESSPYVSVRTGSDMVQTAAASAGMEVCSSDPVSVKISGVTSAMLYLLSSRCSSPDQNDRVEVLALGFSDTDAMRAAISEAQMVTRSWQTLNTAAFMSGETLFVIKGSSRSEAVSEIGTSLIGQGAVRIL